MSRVNSDVRKRTCDRQKKKKTVTGSVGGGGKRSSGRSSHQWQSARLLEPASLVQLALMNPPRFFSFATHAGGPRESRTTRYLLNGVRCAEGGRGDASLTRRYACDIVSLHNACWFDAHTRGCYDESAGWSSLVARWAHNPKVGGSNPPPATKPSVRIPLIPLELPVSR
jgi:hypothetical protein